VSSSSRKKKLQRTTTMVVVVVAVFQLWLLLQTGTDAFRQTSCSTNDYRAPSAGILLDTDHSKAILPPHILSVWGIEPDLSKCPGANFPHGSNSCKYGGMGKTTPPAPILELPNFITVAECCQIQEWAKHAIDSGAEECDDYLNYRVNQEVKADGHSREGKILIDEFGLEGGGGNEECALSSRHNGGFRVRLDDAFVEGMLRNRLLNGVGMTNRKFVFEEGAWIRPTPRTVVVRDKTVVFYGPNNGVPPHVDGKGATLLVYLSDGRWW
jgi:hypothetical protein